MRIALCAPVDLRALASLCGQDCAAVAPGLGSTATTPLIGEFLERGHEVTLYTLSKELAKERTYDWGNLRVFVGRFRERHLAATYYRPEIGFLQQTIKRDAPAFVHAHWTYEFALGALRSGVPTLTTIHDLPWNVLRYYRDPHRAVRLLMAYEVALRGRHFTAVSADSARHFARYLRPGAEIDVVPNGLPDNVFEMGREQRAEGRHPITFATVLQGWSRRKNAKAALEAFGFVRCRLHHARLIMFGYGYEAKGYGHQWAAKKALDKDVHFAGPVPYNDLLKRISEEVDIVVHPSLDEAFSMAALETLALRKSLIAGATTPGMRELIGPEGAALVNVRSPAEIAQAMLQLAVNANYRHHLADRSFDRALKCYRLSTVADRYEALYRKMLHSRTVSAASLNPSSETKVPLDI